ncbi:hypothetical protein FA15DRAFT_661122 [Coprinopsis marcescibilis]|uniref:BED-type domain-containing protein n=1 Tax=Coprinopsis marcescibilis TaxID=230819 RepID=A0A5C3KD33_COPMA|nr:hypothetical protein FA15DRAFT_661122 [Coprinopsis marcescibilis]
MPLRGRGSNRQGSGTGKGSGKAQTSSEAVPGNTAATAGSVPSPPTDTLCHPPKIPIFPSYQSGPVQPTPGNVFLDDNAEYINMSHVSPASSDAEDARPARPVSGPSAGAVDISPIKKHRTADGIGKWDDSRVWDMDDECIIGIFIAEAAWATWISDVYNHFDIGIERLPYSTPGAGDSWMVTGSGTSNLRTGVVKCLDCNHITQPSKVITYSPENHSDPKYIQEVQMLHSNTPISHPSTVSTDIQQIYVTMSNIVCDYLVATVASGLHLVLDGWTATLVACYPGIIVVWSTNRIVHRCILEFICLKESHLGNTWLRRSKTVLNNSKLRTSCWLTLCMDNAGNCSKAARVLGLKLPSFGGDSARLRCLAHIVNLIGKTFLSFIFKQKKTKKVVKHAESDTSELVIEDDGGDSEEDEAVNEESLEVAMAVEAEGGDDGAETHNTAIASTMCQTAIEKMADDGVVIDPATEKAALSIIPWVSGFARRVHNSPTLKEQFNNLVDATDSLEGTTQQLARQVPTRWNSDLACFHPHEFFRTVISGMTSTSGLGLYALSPLQWNLLHDLIEVLKLFELLTDLFSKPDVPLIVDVYPLLTKLECSLNALQDDTPPPAGLNGQEIDHEPTDPVFRVADQASLFMVEKYWPLLNEFMCPDCKAKWFTKANGFPTGFGRKVVKRDWEIFNARY